VKGCRGNASRDDHRRTLVTVNTYTSVRSANWLINSFLGYVDCIEDSISMRVFPHREPDMPRTNTPTRCMKACLESGECRFLLLLLQTASKRLTV